MTNISTSGAFTALVVASLLDLAGIPRGHGDEATLNLFNKFWNNELEDPAASQASKAEYNCETLHFNPRHKGLTSFNLQASMFPSNSSGVSKPLAL